MKKIPLFYVNGLLLRQATFAQIGATGDCKHVSTPSDHFPISLGSLLTRSFYAGHFFWRKRNLRKGLPSSVNCPYRPVQSGIFTNLIFIV